MTDTVVTRTHRVVGAVAGIFFGGNVVVLGFFLEQPVVMAVAGLFVGAGTALLLPALVHAGETGGFPPTTQDAVLGTGLNPGALGIGLDVAGFAVIFAAFVFETPLIPIAVGVAVLAVCYVVLDRVLPQKTVERKDDEDTEEAHPVAGFLGVAAGVLFYTGLTSWSRSASAAYALVGVGMVLVVMGVRMEGYV